MHKDSRAACILLYYTRYICIFSFVFDFARYKSIHPPGAVPRARMIDDSRGGSDACENFFSLCVVLYLLALLFETAMHIIQAMGVHGDPEQSSVWETAVANDIIRA